MKRAALVLALLSLVPAHAAFAHGNDSDWPTLRASCCDPPVRWASRYDPRDARVAITTRDGGATLILTSENVAVQLSDRAFRDIRRKLRDKEDADDDSGSLGTVIRSAVLSGVRAVLDHSAECRVRDLKDVEYRGGRLVFTTEDDTRVFNDIDVNDEDAMSGFSERDARAFVNEFRRVKAHTRD